MGLGQMEFYSDALQRQVSFNFYVPNRDRFDLSRFPALVQLHGRFGSLNDWVQRTKLPVYLLDLPLVAIVPDGVGAETGWSNWRLPDQPLEDFVMRDLIPACEHFFPIQPGRWAIGGNSMGGYGALHLGLKHADRFASIYAHSSVIFSRERIDALRPDLPDTERADADLRTHAARLAADPERPVLGFDCGVEDRLMESNRQFHTYLDEIGYPHEYLELPGGHTWEYWDANLPRALRQHMAVFSVPVG